MSALIPGPLGALAAFTREFGTIILCGIVALGFVGWWLLAPLTGW